MPCMGLEDINMSLFQKILSYKKILTQKQQLETFSVSLSLSMPVSLLSIFLFEYNCIGETLQCTMSFVYST